MSNEIGTVIGDYQIVGILGAGGMGKVYKVRNTISDRIEAMKILLPNLDADQELAERFLREIKVQASLDHPNIAALRTAQRVGNQLIMIMEYIEGSTLEAIMRERRIAVKDCVDYMSQVLSALAYAHGHGIVHRDIKPANMMLTPAGVIKLMDFGIAKVSMDHRLTQTGKTVGSLFYMSPEQIRGDVNLDPRSDLYSLGISFYEMVTGRRPFEGESDYSIMAAHLQQAPQPPIQLDPSLPSALNDVILISIAKDPGQRFQTADAFRGALKAIESDLGVGAAMGAGGTQLFTRPTPPSQPRPATVVEPMPSPVPAAPRPSQPQLQSMAAPPPPPPQAASQPRVPAFGPPPPQQFQHAPQPFRNVPPPQAQAGGHRGLYMVLGSLVTIGILVAGALYVPKLFKTQAGTTTTSQSTSQPKAAEQTPQQTPPQQTPTQVAQVTPPPQAPPSAGGTPQVEPQKPSPMMAPQAPVQQAVPRPQPRPRADAQTPPPTRMVQQEPVQAPVQQPPQAPVQAPAQTQAAMPQPGSPAAPRGNPAASELQELAHDRDLMIPRIEAVNTSMAKLQQEQSRMGLGISGDLIARQRRVQFYMETANEALRRGNVAEARTSLNNAERELGKLEDRFGR
jgi:serine/threonine-protein kinase